MEGQVQTQQAVSQQPVLQVQAQGQQQQNSNQNVQQQNQQKHRQINEQITQSLTTQIDQLFEFDAFLNNKYFILNCSQDFKVSLWTIIEEQSIKTLLSEIKVLPIQRKIIESAIEQSKTLKKIDPINYQVANVKKNRTQIDVYVPSQKNASQILEVIKKYTDFDKNFILQSREKSKFQIFGDTQENTIKLFDHLFSAKLPNGENISATIKETDYFSKAYFNLLNQQPDIGRIQGRLNQIANESLSFIQTCDLQQQQYNQQRQQYRNGNFNPNNRLGNPRQNYNSGNNYINNNNRQGQRNGNYNNGGNQYNQRRGNQGQQQNYNAQQNFSNQNRNQQQQSQPNINPQEFPDLQSVQTKVSTI